ncbi:DNA polymerase III subunit delta' [Clostridium weizhouense]|uniref:DNA polymerase III subunit delta' n=1 Tax=Clostridium weizhouense TaxID=2859781 RepID=A0ABS7ARP8_9CLOT|nr:DNA polymerase III subunit delta' [Clostridium weizhouense]MBW6410341.1 DNA polymerase III subunit delta' [Clostridium weizhouense]
MREIIGHKKIINGFNKRKINDSFSHANLIIGDDGIGKSMLANYLANNILGVTYDREYVDIINYYPSLSSFGVDDIRAIIDETNKKPYEGERKVLILHKCNKLTISAQNALLKTIEEPPKGVFLILLSESLELILDTIKSRCQIYKLTPLSKEEMLEYIKYNYSNLDEKDIRSALAYSEGIPGKIDKFIKDEKLKILRVLLLELLKDVVEKNKDLVLKYKESLIIAKESPEDLLNILISYIRDIMFLKELDNEDLIINFDSLYEIKDISLGISYKKLNCMLEYIREARVNLNSNTNYSMAITVLLMGFAEV